MASGSNGSVLRQVERLFTAGSLAGLSEGQLLERFASRRDEAAFAALVARHGPMVLGVCRRVLRDPNDVDDAFQATFLVLARRAGSLQDRTLLANWLHGVARRVALRARSRAARRHKREQTGAAAGDGAIACEPSSEAADRHDLRAVIDEELSRLPESQRRPIVLCHLEGLTHEEAAARLQWPVGTVRSRMARGRERLRTRLARRGLAPTALGFAAGWPEFAPAAVPPALADATVRAAIAFAATSQLAAGALSAGAVTLARGVMNAMLLSKLKAVAAVGLMAIGLASGGAAVIAQQTAGDRGTGAAGPAIEPLVPHTAVGIDTAQPAAEPATTADVGNVAERLRALESELKSLREALGLTGPLPPGFPKDPATRAARPEMDRRSMPVGAGPPDAASQRIVGRVQQKSPDGQRVTISLGSTSGLRRSEELGVFREGDRLSQSMIALVRVEEIRSKDSDCRVVMEKVGQPIQAGDIVARLEPPTISGMQPSGQVAAPQPQPPGTAGTDSPGSPFETTPSTTTSGPDPDVHPEGRPRVFLGEVQIYEPNDKLLFVTPGGDAGLRIGDELFVFRPFSQTETRMGADGKPAFSARRPNPMILGKARVERVDPDRAAGTVTELYIEEGTVTALGIVVESISRGDKVIRISDLKTIQEDDALVPDISTIPYPWLSDDDSAPRDRSAPAPPDTSSSPSREPETSRAGGVGMDGPGGGLESPRSGIHTGPWTPGSGAFLGGGEEAGGPQYLQSESIILYLPKSQNRITAFSIPRGEWYTQDLPKSSQGSYQPTLSKNLAVLVAGNTAYAFSALTRGWTAQDLPDPEEAERSPPIVSDLVAAIRTGNRVYAFSASQGRWDELVLAGDPPLGKPYPLVSQRTAIVEHAGTLHIFSAETGTWSTPDIKAAAAPAQTSPPAPTESVLAPSPTPDEGAATPATTTAPQAGRPAGEGEPTIQRWNNFVLVTSPDSNRVTVHNVLDGSKSTYRAPRGTKVRFTYNGIPIALQFEGPDIRQIAAYEPRSKRWIVQNLHEPVHGRLQPFREHSGSVLYLVDRHVYWLKPTIESDRGVGQYSYSAWEVRELEEAPTVEVSPTPQELTLREGPRLHILNLQRGTWTTIDTEADDLAEGESPEPTSEPAAGPETTPSRPSDAAPIPTEEAAQQPQPSIMRYGNRLVVTSPERDRITIQDIATDAKASYEAPEGSKVILPVLAWNVVAPMIRGPEITQIAAYSPRTGTWSVQELREPTELARPDVGPNLAIYQIGRFSYVYCPNAEELWRVFELEEGQPPPSLDGDSLKVREGHRLHLLNPQTGEWKSIEIDDP